jgi:hypothetical protein
MRREAAEVKAWESGLAEARAKLLEESERLLETLETQL